MNIYREFKQNSLIIGIPGAFIPSIQYKILAEYRRHYNELRALCKIEKAVIISVNDPYVLKSFAEEIDAGDSFIYTSDYNGECIKSLGSSINLPLLGLRSKPFRCIIKNGEITNWICDEDWKPTSATRVYKLLRDFCPYPPYPYSVYPD